MKKKIFLFLIIAFTTSLSSIVLSKKFYEPLNIKLSTNSLKLKKALRVYNNQEMTQYRDLIIFPSVKDYELIDQEIWGLCFIKGSKLKIIPSEGNVDVVMQKVTNNKYCSHLSRIKRYNSTLSNDFTIYSKIISLLFIITATVMIYYGFLQIQSVFFFGKEKFYYMTLSFFYICMSFYYLCVYPGLFDTDLLYAIDNAHHLNTHSWFTVFNDLFVSACLNIYNKISFLSFIMLNLYFYIFFQFLTIAYKLRIPKYQVIITTILLLLYSTSLQALYLSRDGFIGLSIILLCLLSIDRFITKSTKQLEYYNEYLFCFFLSIVSCLRRETLITALVALLIYFFINKMTKKKSLFILMTVLLFQTGIYITKSTFNSSDKEMINEKNITSFSLIVGEMLKQKYQSQTPAQDMKTINKYYNIDIIKKYHADNLVQAANHGAIRENLPTDIKDLYLLIKKMIIENPWIFIKSRLIMMKHHLFATEGTLSFPRVLHHIPDNPPGYETLVANTNNLLQDKEDAQSMKNLYDLGNLMVFSYDTKPATRILYTFIPSIVLLFLSIFFLKRAPLSLLIGLICIARVPIYFLLSPAAQIKYLFDFYLYAAIFFPVFLWELNSPQSKLIIIRTNKFGAIVLTSLRRFIPTKREKP